MAGLRFLVPTIEVRILVPQLKLPSATAGGSFSFGLFACKPNADAGLGVMEGVPAYPGMPRPDARVSDLADLVRDFLGLGKGDSCLNGPIVPLGDCRADLVEDSFRPLD